MHSSVLPFFVKAVALDTVSSFEAFDLFLFENESSFVQN